MRGRYVHTGTLLLLNFFNSVAPEPVNFSALAFSPSAISVLKSTFKNLLPDYSPDPWAMYQDGFYYYTYSTHDSLTIWKTADIIKLEQAEQKVVWKAYGPGHGCFFQTANGQNWLLYHANPGCVAGAETNVPRACNASVGT